MQRQDGLEGVLGQYLRGVDRLTCAALCLTVLGWSLFWAGSLSLLGPLPLWLPAVLFVFGLLLIPFRAQAAGPLEPKG